MSQTMVTKKNYQIGMRVVRGRDWSWGDQDGGPGGIGTIIGESSTSGMVRVQWDAGRTDSYYCDREYDLYFYVPEETSSEDLLTIGNAYVGAKVKLRLAKDFRSPMAKRHLEEGFEYTIESITQVSRTVHLRESSGAYSINNFVLLSIPLKASLVDETRSKLEKMASRRDSESYEYTSDLSSSKNLKTNTNDTGNSNPYAGTALKLPSKNLTLQRGERPQGSRLKS